jgi:NAD(P)-dependent dehydrogenase (short-subunit alcohol dehydrogenase family)
MIKQGRGGRIIGSSSLVGKQGEYNSWIPPFSVSHRTMNPGMANQAAYSSSKFAVRGLTQAAGQSPVPSSNIHRSHPPIYY